MHSLYTFRTQKPPQIHVQIIIFLPSIMINIDIEN